MMKSTMNRAVQVGENAASFGFDWACPEDAIKKIVEECDELATATSVEHRIEEFGDLMFAVMNVARQYQIDPNEALENAITKFEHRFSYVQAKIEAHSTEPSLETMESWWRDAKSLE